MSKASDLANKAKGGNSSTNDTSAADARKQLEEYLKERAAWSGDRELCKKVIAELENAIAEGEQAYGRCALSIMSSIKELDLIDGCLAKMKALLKKMKEEAAD